MKRDTNRGEMIKAYTAARTRGVEKKKAKQAVAAVFGANLTRQEAHDAEAALPKREDLVNIVRTKLLDGASVATALKQVRKEYGRAFRHAEALAMWRTMQPTATPEVRRQRTAKARAARWAPKDNEPTDTRDVATLEAIRDLTEMVRTVVGLLEDHLTRPALAPVAYMNGSGVAHEEQA